MSKEAMKLALDALRKSMQGNLVFDDAMEAFKALEEALAKQEQGGPVTADEKLARMKSELAYMRGQQEQGEPVATLRQSKHALFGKEDVLRYSHEQPKQEQGDLVEYRVHPITGTVGVFSKSVEPKQPKQEQGEPQQRTWVGLDPEEIRKTNHHMVDGAYHYSFKQGAEWAEAKLKEKNGA